MSSWTKGYRAAELHLTMDNNPYIEDSFSYDEWIRGYNDWHIDQYGDVI